LRRRGASEAAENLASEAITYIEDSDFIPVHAQALMDLEEVLRVVGPPSEGVPILDRTVRLWEQKGNPRRGRARARAQGARPAFLTRH
jgi:hypothetical protein